mmetsp:Transcript_85117/g.190070  ORF Transcript_85117/g.190070 Transcript_85117/m.190070 type:complete len:313 (-) Transcript_85117:330-1268(-)
MRRFSACGALKKSRFNPGSRSSAMRWLTFTGSNSSVSLFSSVSFASLIFFSSASSSSSSPSPSNDSASSQTSSCASSCGSTCSALGASSMAVLALGASSSMAVLPLGASFSASESESDTLTSLTSILTALTGGASSAPGLASGALAFLGDFLAFRVSWASSTASEGVGLGGAAAFGCFKSSSVDLGGDATFVAASCTSSVAATEAVLLLPCAGAGAASLRPLPPAPFDKTAPFIDCCGSAATSECFEASGESLPARAAPDSSAAAIGLSVAALSFFSGIEESTGAGLPSKANCLASAGLASAAFASFMPEMP